jgi:WhiB family redox-sensing transcriptional regulator
LKNFKVLALALVRDLRQNNSLIRDLIMSEVLRQDQIYPENANWRESAECSNEEPKIFFSGIIEYTDYAKTICAKCVVRSDCLESALETREVYGIWGGLTEIERGGLIRERLRAARRRSN